MLKQIDIANFGASSNMLQSGFWAEFKHGFGWKPFAFEYNETKLLVLCKSLGGGYSLAYVPHGPSLSDGTWDKCLELAKELKSFLPKKCMFIRFDPPWGLRFPALGKELKGYPEAELSPENGFYKANMDIQPPSTVILDLAKTEDELLKGMKSKTRYNVKLAAKKGVIVKTTGIEGLPEWYQLYKVTSERDKITIHPYSYYESFFTLAKERHAEGDNSGAPELRLLQAEIEGKVEAGIIVTFQGGGDSPKCATYLYGASSNNKRNYMPAYALQWEAIRQAKAAGCVSYDFFGIPPVDNPEHPMYGLYRFKTGFGGEILHRPGCWDVPFKKGLYKIFGNAEKFRHYYYKTLKKR
ncbi:MAG: peptidoglycan bridge formation glycyltransferase FemA/FemB family protein [Spirochaetales bacterium]|nr:peptidoglycan bridge formation glycyltransferase FemA/FemB family protein [Spirochaetales bacterium]